MKIFDDMYAEVPKIFGNHLVWDGQPFVHGEWKRVAHVPKAPVAGDGQPVDIYECRMPARFYKMVVLEADNSIGKRNPGGVISSGSGEDMGRLFYRLALKFAEGMAGFDKE